MEVDRGILRLRGGNKDADKFLWGLPAQQDAESNVQLNPPGVGCWLEAGVQLPQIRLEKLCYPGPYDLTGQFRILRQFGRRAYDCQVCSFHRLLLSIPPAAGWW